MKFVGYIQEIDHKKKEFHIILMDEDDIPSIATVDFNSIPEEHKDRIVVGNYLNYEVTEHFENLNLHELKVWTKEDEERVRRKEEDGSQDTK